MRKLLLFIFVLFLIPACGMNQQVNDPVKRFGLLTDQKRELTKEYFKYLRGTDRNEKKLKELDRKILDLNKEISKLSANPEVKEYIEEQLQQRKRVEAPSENDTRSSATESQTPSSGRVEYISDDLETTVENDFVVDENTSDKANDDIVDSANEEYLGDTVDQEMEIDFNQKGEVEYEDETDVNSEGNNVSDLEDPEDVEYYDDGDLGKE